MTPIYNGFVYFVWFLATFYSIFFFLTLIVFKDKVFENKKQTSNNNPLISMIVPAYNEEEKIAETISSLKKLKYKNIEVIILSDGSIDKTSEVVMSNIADDSRFTFIDNKINKGKASVLNQGIDIAKGEFVVCMDADSSVEQDIIEKVLPYFEDDKVGAVTVSVVVKNPKSFLHKIIALEFVLGLSLFLKVFSFLDCVFVTPGPFSIFRMSALKDLKGFDTKNITEDLEIAYRLHKKGYKIKNCIEANVYTVLPDTFSKIRVQRKRWYSGAIYTVFQHRDALFNKKYGLFSFFTALNFTLIFLGLSLFLTSIWLTLSRFFQNLSYYQYTNYNFFDYWNFNFNILHYGRIDILGISMFIWTIFLMTLGLILARQKFGDNKQGLIGYPFMFLLYQLFWFESILAVINKKKIKWR